MEPNEGLAPVGSTVEDLDAASDNTPDSLATVRSDDDDPRPPVRPQG